MTEIKEIDLGLERPPSRFIVGIDLGTTNCAVAYVDTQLLSREVSPFPIDQLVDWSTIERRDTLPSFLYQLTPQEQSSPAFHNKSVFRRSSVLQTELRSNPKSTASSNFQSASCIVGALARDRGLQMPGRQIASAKSWLCHSGIDRTAPILPWHGDEDVELLSPVQASSHYLDHIRRVWDQHHPRDLLAEQDVVLTLPASFDEVARELTIEAARLAGLPRLFLVEEPQAAFYAWLARHGNDWHRKIQVGQTILVCDIGGGTTDFTLIRVRETHHDDSASTPEASLHRVAVGQHLILGGDNLDLALAKAVELMILKDGPSPIHPPNNSESSDARSAVSSQSRGYQLPPRQWDALRMNCRIAKEVLLGSNPPERYTITLPGSGTRLLGTSQSISIDRPLVQEVLLEGFFSKVPLQGKPNLQTIGFQEFGLPYASDPVITKHLAGFLWEHRRAGRDGDETSKLNDISAAKPDWILFNGGVLEAKQIRTAILDQLHDWFAGCDASTPDQWQVGVLEGNRLDLAVAIGAAYFGLVRRGEGVRIDANLARSYYLTVSDEPLQAMCLVPGNATAGDRFRLESRLFDLAVGEPVQFPLWVSSLNLVDAPGALLDIDRDRMKAMPSIRTVLELPRSRQQSTLPVYIEAELTEIGTLSMACVSQDQKHRWSLDFDIRSAVETDREAHAGQGELEGLVEQSVLDKARIALESVFGENAVNDPKRLLNHLADAVGKPRAEWPPSFLRSIWQTLIDLDYGRKKSVAHEARWLNLLGYCLRPGYGFAADDWRVATTWRRVQGKLIFPSVNILSEAIILWRRIAGGFTAGQQQALYQEIAPRIRGILNSESKSSLAVSSTNEAIELFRLVGSLELLSVNDKAQLGSWCIAALKRKKLAIMHPAILWTLGRLGSRVPVYGPINHLISIDRAQNWINELLKCEGVLPELALAILQLSRMTGDRYRDLTEVNRDRVLQWMADRNVSNQYQQLVREVVQLDTTQQSAIVGESLPLGIRLKQ